jgi:hypothetical protein
MLKDSQIVARLREISMSRDLVRGIRTSLLYSIISKIIKFY